MKKVDGNQPPLNTSLCSLTKKSYLFYDYCVNIGDTELAAGNACLQNITPSLQDMSVVSLRGQSGRRL